MWKQKLKICAINLMAYGVALAIIAIVSNCFRLCGQENRVLSFDRTYKIVTDMDYEHR